MHAAARSFFRRHLADLPPLRVVEFGSLNINGSIRDVYPQARSWLGVDIQPGDSVDVVADAATWQTRDTFDVCVSGSVFEHTPAWADIITNAQRVLEVGGLFLASCARDAHPAHSAVDGGRLRDGEFYANVGAVEMTAALHGWSDVSVVEADGYYGNDDLYVRAVK